MYGSPSIPNSLLVRVSSGWLRLAEKRLPKLYEWKERIQTSPSESSVQTQTNPFHVDNNMPTIHEYPVLVHWRGGRDGEGDLTPTTSGTHIDLRVPTEFNGPGGATNPEELLTSAVAGCYSITFGIVAANRKLPIVSIETKATGQVEQSGANFVYKQIAIRPVITATAESTDEQIAQIEDFALKADAYCIITNAVRGKVEIVLEPTVKRAI